MQHTMTISQLWQALPDAAAAEGISLTGQIIDGEVAVLQVVLQDQEEFPIYVTVDDCQILCVTYLCQESEILPAKREALLEALLTLNLPMPLSSFSKIGRQYIIFGALSTRAGIADILHEIVVLGGNTLDAVALMTGYLR